MPSVMPTYDPKTFHLDFEKTFGPLEPAAFPPIDWAERGQLEMLFPLYKREQLRIDSTPGGQRSKNIDIEGFSLKSPDNSQDLFYNTHLMIESFKRCALYGINGSGKTCLFDAISSGNVTGIPSYLHVHHMKELEHNEQADAVSVMDTVLSSHPYRRVLLPMEKHLLALLEAKDQPEEVLSKYEANLEYVRYCLETCHGSYAFQNARAMLRVLGFDEVGEAAPLSSLSGGLRMRVALACAFFINPEILLLDEPTNHLDMPSVLWLENKLRGYKGSFLLVTHDRTLLENVVTSVMLIQDTQLQYFPCDFKEFEKRKEQNDKAREKMIETFLKRNTSLNPMSPLFKQQIAYQKWQAGRRERQLLLQGKFTFQLPKPLVCPPGVEQADLPLITIDNVRFSYDEAKGLPFIFDNPVSYVVRQGTRVGVMGPNGAGKSTFLKLITGKIFPTSGTITNNPDFTTAYFGQHSTKELKLDDTALEFMCASFPKENAAVLKNHLSKTSIQGETANTRMKNLSFSQRSCIIFAKLTFVPPHLLIMDEPTNFLDIDSVDSLIGAVNKFGGAVITVTHNRDFLKRCSKIFLSIVPGAFLEFKTMKEAERATYSFITALEEGKEIDVKKAIQDNRGGGAIHTEEYLAASKDRLNAQQQKAKDEADAIQAEADRLAAIQLEKEEKRKAKAAAQKTDWKADDKCWANVSSKWVIGTVVRNVPAMGVTVELASGKKILVEAKKLKEENPEGGENASAAAEAPKPATPKGGAAPGGGGRGGARGGAAAGGAQRGGRGGGRGRGK